MATDFIVTHQRQVHLDFHTSPFIPDVGSEFDADAFAETFVRARVNSVTVFAKCHHGMCYYPTKTGVQHPALRGRDLLGEQIEALHRRGIRCPIYTTIVWEEDVAQRHPEWRQMRQDGTFAGWNTAANQKDAHPGAWKFNNFLDPDYQDYVEAHVREVCASYPVDGFFFDILMLATGACWSEASVRFREQHGFLKNDLETFQRFEAAAQAAFARKFTALVHSYHPAGTVFYNSGNEMNVDTRVGPRARLADQTHLEIESLPSGVWGYAHFPRMARGQMYWGKPWLGMTGRFQKMWGDFGGIKPVPALEYECFRSQAMGGGSSIGDQLPPRGALDVSAYELIGSVYEQWAQAEPFYAGSRPCPQIGIFCANYPGFDLAQAGKSEEGPVQMCDETHYDCAVLDEQSALDGFRLLVLPDSTVITPMLAERLADFHARGGALVLSHRAGFDAAGEWALRFLPLTFAGPQPLYPTYWRARAAFDTALGRSDRVIYEQGLNVLGGEGTQVLIDRVLPYFQRTDIRFSSHFQTPPTASADRFPAVIAGAGFVYFADPIFRSYRQSGSVMLRDVWARVVGDFIGGPQVGDGLPTTIQAIPRRRGTDLIVTLLHYIPIRKALDIDVVEERSTFAGEIFRVKGNVARVQIYGEETHLPRQGDGFLLPQRKGRLLLEVPDYFGAP